MVQVKQNVFQIRQEAKSGYTLMLQIINVEMGNSQYRNMIKTGTGSSDNCSSTECLQKHFRNKWIADISMLKDVPNKTSQVGKIRNTAAVRISGR